MRRATRNREPYQNEENLLELIDEMKAAVCPEGATLADFRKLLYAVQYYERKGEVGSRAGRRGSFSEEYLSAAALKLKSILQVHSRGRISLLRFVSTFLPVLDYPGDIRAALNADEINLVEARSLARINSRNLGHKYKSRPVDIRREMLAQHLKRRDTQAELERRVAEKLARTPKAEASRVTGEVIVLEERHDELLEFTEFDTGHLLWEEIKSLVYLARRVDASAMSDEQTVDILDDLDAIKLKLGRFVPRADG